MTAPAAGRFNQPLPVNKTAIINHLAHHATNGPAYVQLGATKALARLTGLYDQARYEAKLAYEAARKAAEGATQQVKAKVEDGKMTIGERVEGLIKGTIQPTAEELSWFKPDKDKPVEDEEEADETEQKDEPP